MEMYIWHQLEDDNGDDNDIGLTNRYHSGGGAAVVAMDIESAITLLQAKAYNHDICPGDPDSIYELRGQYEPKVFIFPNKGCC